MMAYTTAAFQLKEKVRVLAVAKPQRHPRLPDVPTFKELGIDWVDGDPEYQKKMAAGGFEVIDVGPERIDAFMAERAKGYLSVAKSMGLIK